ncbi:MAG: hypothetical protein OXF68_16385 [Gammaproteobacteria bacterium]|nr:hypothetical protein [Gammaproteobacteria bacterium]MCY4343416.1 hypothetical protein [Gammaproteobacteria bacterium]
MKRALGETSEMTTSLEASGVERRQAGAILEAIANSIERFAVTPERLRKALEESQQTLYERIKAEFDLRFDGVMDGVNQRFEGVNQRFEGVNMQFEGVNKQFEAVNKQFEAVNQRLDDIVKNQNERFNEVQQQQRAESTKLFNLMLAMALGMAGVAGGFIFDKLTLLG